MVIFLHVVVSYSEVPQCKLLALQTFSWIVEGFLEADSVGLSLCLIFSSSRVFLIPPSPLFLITCPLLCPNMSKNVDAYFPDLWQGEAPCREYLCDWQVSRWFKCSDVLCLPDAQCAAFSKSLRPSHDVKIKEPHKTTCIYWLNFSCILLLFHAISSCCSLILIWIPFLSGVLESDSWWLRLSFSIRHWELTQLWLDGDKMSHAQFPRSIWELSRFY